LDEIALGKSRERKRSRQCSKACGISIFRYKIEGESQQKTEE
jgi:hypothetical protein